MADAFYIDYRNALSGAGTHGAVDWDLDTMRAALRDEGAVALNLTTQIDLADVSAGHVGTAQTLASVTIGVAGDGAVDHALVTWPSVTGASCESIDFYKDTGTPATSPLCVNIDSSTGLPVVPNGGDITFDPAAGGLFQI